MLAWSGLCNSFSPFTSPFQKKTTKIDAFTTEKPIPYNKDSYRLWEKPKFARKRFPIPHKCTPL